MAPPRVAERRHEHERLDLSTADLDQVLAEVDLQLPPRRRLESRRCEGLGLQRLPIGLNRALQRPPADGQTLLGKQLLAHHVGIAAMPDEPFA